jgi:flagellar protein FliS
LYATANIYDSYKQNHVTTASPIDLIIMLYDGCIKNLKIAKLLLEDTGSETAAQDFLNTIEKAEEIVLELIRSLNFKVEMSNDLMNLYEFMLNEMVEVTVSKEKERLDPVIDMLSSLREAWAEAKKTVGGSSSYALSE